MKELPLYLCPLEPYQSRYTELLAKWERRAFRKAGFKIRTVPGHSPLERDSTVAMNIITGEVLDSVQRPIWAMNQIIALLQARQGNPEYCQVYFSDFFHPGLEALAYSRLPFRASAFCWAQSFDRYDFTTGMIPWMRPWEIMAFELYRHVFVANEGLKDLIVSALPSAERKIHVVGLPFNSRAVGRMVDLTFNQGVEYDGVYASRWDVEKNPALFLDLVEACPEHQFAVCTGSPELTGTALHTELLQRIERAQNLTVHTNLQKSEYYAILSNSRVQINTALQDWTSFTLLEALTFDCLPLYPNFRSFPDALNYDPQFLYRPFDPESLTERFLTLLDSEATAPQEVLEYNDGTLSRIAEIIGNDRVAFDR